MNDLLEIKEVRTSSDEYIQSLKLREKVLREPIGLKISQEQIDNEQNQNHYHFIARKKNELVSALTMKINPNSIQTCQIATEKKYRGNGIGKTLLEYGEKKILSLCEKKEFVVFSRLDSLMFYKKCNYEFKNGRVYLINGIEHRLLKKTCGNNVYKK
jgi:hypothetical protein